MKPLWPHTFAWIVAVVVAVLLALSVAEVQLLPFGFELVPHGSEAPR
jgi:hypothetical protein